MNDERLRELERRFLETQAVADEAAWLGARVQAGQVSRDRLELAAILGDPAAKRLSESSLDMSLREFLELTSEVDRLAFARVGLALLRPERPPPRGWQRALYRAFEWVAQLGEISLEGPHLDALEAVEAWALEPSPEHAEEAIRVGTLALELAERLEARWDGWTAPDSLPEMNRLHAEVFLARSWGQLAVSVGTGGVTGFVEVVGSAAGVRENAALLEEVVPWLLGREDPLATKAALREASAGSAVLEAEERG